MPVARISCSVLCSVNAGASRWMLHTSADSAEKQTATRQHCSVRGSKAESGGFLQILEVEAGRQAGRKHAEHKQWHSRVGHSCLSDTVHHAGATAAAADSAQLPPKHVPVTRPAMPLHSLPAAAAAQGSNPTPVFTGPRIAEKLPRTLQLSLLLSLPNHCIACSDSCSSTCKLTSLQSCVESA